MSVIVTRAGKGIPLTFADGDANFTNLNNDKAETASPTFTGVPAAPTAAAGTNTTQIATTAFVIGQLSAVAPPMDGVAAVGTSTNSARADHVHPVDTSRQAALGFTPVQQGTGIGQLGNIVKLGWSLGNKLKATVDVTDLGNLALESSPQFIGQPTAPTPLPSSNNTQIATTAYVDAVDVLKAPLASPTFTGVPAAPTAAVGTNTTQLATTAFVAAAGLLPALAGNANKFVKTDGTTASWQYLLNWTLQAVSLNPCVVGTAYAVRTNLSALTMTLPALPAANDIIYFMDADNNAAVNNFTIARNGNTIMGLAEDMTVAKNGASFSLQYINSSWRLV